MTEATILRYTHLGQDLQALYNQVRLRLQSVHLQTVADDCHITEDALQRWRRGDTRQPHTIHLIQVAAYLQIPFTWIDDTTRVYGE